jgi:hypothetical protein
MVPLENDEIDSPMKGLDVKTIGIFKNPMVGYMI